MMNNRNFKIRGLGEIAIRCSDLEKMKQFYRDILGLEVMPGDYREGIVFFRIAEGFGGHTVVLALFQDDSAGQTGISGESGRDSLHHLALSLPFDEQEWAMGWFELHGIEFQVERFDWIGWRGVFTKDPEGNHVELVAYDRSMLRKS